MEPLPAHIIEVFFGNFAGSASSSDLGGFVCVSFLLSFLAEALASLSARTFSAEHVGRKHRRVSPRSLHLHWDGKPAVE